MIIHICGCSCGEVHKRDLPLLFWDMLGKGFALYKDPSDCDSVVTLGVRPSEKSQVPY